jgi:hypothetical protein
MHPYRGPSQEVKIELIKALSKKQRQRLIQISIQYRSPMVFIDPEVIDALNLTYPQRHEIKMIQNEELGGFWPGKKDSQPPGAESSAKTKTLDRILELLTAEQREAWHALCGKPFYTNH